MLHTPAGGPQLHGAAQGPFRSCVRPPLSAASFHFLCVETFLSLSLAAGSAPLSTLRPLSVVLRDSTSRAARRPFIAAAPGAVADAMKSSTSLASLGAESSAAGRPLTSASALSASPSAAGLSRSGSRSMCGPQTHSHKTSAPSFSFGSGPARINFTGPQVKGPIVLQASVPGSASESPGPIYNPAPSRKWFGDAPNARFGTEEQRPTMGQAKSDISKLTGKSLLPGPGQYPLPPSVGKQPLGRMHSGSQYSFGMGKQRENAAKATPSPGPVYDPKGTIRGSMERASYSFGNEIRIKNRDPSARMPGPGTYSLKPALGPQPYSTNKSAMQIAFGTPTANSSSRGILPLEGRHSPGPVYMNAAACKKQALSTKRSAGTMVFSKADRFKTYGTLGDTTPGPGEYVV